MVRGWVLGWRLGALAVVLLLLGCAHGAPTPEDRPYVIIFGTDDASLNSAGQQLITQIAAAVSSQRPRRVLVTGYGDLEGTPGVPLGHKRAVTVMNALGVAGVNPGIIHEQFAMDSPSAPTGIPVHKVVVTFEP
jgi:hypothetical protein